MDKMTFYKKYPKFDWVYYVEHYEDILKAGINNEENAIKHYYKYGRFQNRRTHIIICNNITEKYDIGQLAKQCYVSNGLIHFKERLYKKYNLTEYIDINAPSLFFGIYTDDDINTLINNIGFKFIIWGGEDANITKAPSRSTIDTVMSINNTIHLAISMCIYNRLLSCGIHSIPIDFNLVDKNIFKPVDKKLLGQSIYIYNGHTEGREMIYGKHTYMEVVQKLPKFNFIYSNTINEKYENMPQIYMKCFIALRLTQYDGNANTVQELETMGIPVIHNQSTYGLKWTTVDDIINHITFVS
jgi:hypothetical protein